MADYPRAYEAYPPYSHMAYLLHNTEKAGHFTVKKILPVRLRGCSQWASPAAQGLDRAGERGALIVHRGMESELLVA